jgi:beta-glucanase (GH16 family)
LRAAFVAGCFPSIPNRSGIAFCAKDFFITVYAEICALIIIHSSQQNYSKKIFLHGTISTQKRSDTGCYFNLIKIKSDFSDRGTLMKNVLLARNSLRKISCAGLATIMLASCGGGGGSDTGTTSGEVALQEEYLKTLNPNANTNANPKPATSPTDTTTTPSTTTPSTTPPSTTPSTPAPTAAGPYGQDASQYVLTFSDEFDNGLSSEKWKDTQWYESRNPTPNYAVENGALKIWPQRDASGNFFNRTIDTDGKYSQTYGYFEMEAKLPYGKGVWPAFWLYAHPGDDRPEIDIMEAYPGGGPDSGWGDANLHPVDFGITLHKANGNYSYHEVPYAKNMSNFLPMLDLSAGFHRYAVKWTATEIQFYFDGKPLGPSHRNDGYWNKPMYILLDLWFGSASGQPDNTTPTGKGNSFEVNYVRAWQLK